MGVEFSMCRTKSDSYRVLMGKPEGKRSLGNLGIGMGIILEYILQTRGGSVWMEFF
jgi:hypothetical protein